MKHSDDTAGIRRVLTNFIEAWNRHDATAFSMLFAEDADFTNVRGMSAHGRSAIEAFHAPLFATLFKHSHQELLQVEIRFLRVDVAAVAARWRMSGARTPAGAERPLRTGLLTLVLLRDGREWLIAVMHNMELPSS